MHPVLLHQFRRALLRAAAKMGAMFGDSMRRNITAVLDSHLASVQTLRGDSELQELREVLIRACMLAYELREGGREGDHELSAQFSSRGVYERLSELASRVVGGWLSSDTRFRLRIQLSKPPGTAVLSRLKVPEQAEGQSEPEPPLLYFRDLEWLAELLWYCFRFDAAAYPSNEELAFQVTIDERHFEQKPNIGDAAQLRGTLDGRRLSDWYSHYHPIQPEANDGMRVFYDTLARMLAAQYKEYVSGDHLELDEMPAVAFSTAFDLELEEALLRCTPDPCHVAIPVRIVRSRRLNDSQMRWLLGTVMPGGDPKRPEWQWFPDYSPLLPESVEGALVMMILG
jgi:hypothetical protein